MLADARCDRGPCMRCNRNSTRSRIVAFGSGFRPHGFDANVHTTTVYSPANDDQPTPTVESMYDCGCALHEIAGMTGRLIAGSPAPLDFSK